MARLSRRAFVVAWAGGIVAAAGAAGAYAWRIEPNRISLSRRTLPLPRWPEDEPPLKVGQLTDLHCDSFPSVLRARRAADLLMKQNPDLVVLTGDFVTSHGEQWAEPAADVLSQTARAPMGAFAVLGNHDYWSNSSEVLMRELGRIGVPVLQNEALPVPGRRNLWILGVKSIATGAADAKVAAIGVPENAVKILLAHEPDFVDFAGIKAVVQLSGHSHGGQVRIPFLPVWTPTGARKYHTGFYPHAPIPIYVSRGIGTIGPPLRFRCPPEATVLTLTAAVSAMER